MYTVCNVKCHVKTSPFSLSEEVLKKSRKCKNFYTYKVQGISFVLFPTIGFLNISGIKCFAHIKDIPPLLFHQFKINIRSDNIIVDNTTASGKLIINQSLSTLNFDEKEWTVNFRPQIFPAAIIRRRNCHRKKGSIILFANGKFIIVGGKNEEDIKSVYSSLKSSLLNPP